MYGVKQKRFVTQRKLETVFYWSNEWKVKMTKVQHIDRLHSGGSKRLYALNISFKR